MKRLRRLFKLKKDDTISHYRDRLKPDKSTDPLVSITNNKNKRSSLAFSGDTVTEQPSLVSSPVEISHSIFDIPSTSIKQQQTTIIASLQKSALLNNNNNIKQQRELGLGSASTTTDFNIQLSMQGEENDSDNMSRRDSYLPIASTPTINNKPIIDNLLSTSPRSFKQIPQQIRVCNGKFLLKIY